MPLRTSVQRLAQVRRERELASDRRAGTFATQKARRKQWTFARRNWKLLLMVLAAFWIVPLPFLAIVPSATARSFAAGGLIVSGFWAAWWMTVQLTGTALTMAGALGEQWSASELRKLRRRGWRLLNHVVLRHHDIDHIAVGPGGVLLVESKWTSEPWTLDTPYLRKAVDRISGDATAVQGMTQAKVGRGKVQALVLVWGAGLEPTGTEPLRLGKVLIADSESIGPTLSELETREALTPQEADAVWSILEQHVRRRDAADLARSERPLPSFEEVAWTVASGVFGALVGLIVPAFAVRVSRVAWPSAAVAALLLASGWKGRRRRILKWFPAGLVLGAEFWLVLVTATYLLLLSPLL